jgi:hypothetical protein
MRAAGTAFVAPLDMRQPPVASAHTACPARWENIVKGRYVLR